MLRNWKAHAKIQALLKEKKFHLKKSLTSLLHQAIQLFISNLALPFSVTDWSKSFHLTCVHVPPYLKASSNYNALIKKSFSLSLKKLKKMKKKITDHFESVMFDTLPIGLLPVIELLTITYLFNEVCYQYVHGNLQINNL